MNNDLKDYKRMVEINDIKRQMAMSHKELFIMNGTRAGMKSFAFIVGFYFVFHYLFKIDVTFTAVNLIIAFLIIALQECFFKKWFGKGLLKRYEKI